MVNLSLKPSGFESLLNKLTSIRAMHLSQVDSFLGKWVEERSMITGDFVCRCSGLPGLAMCADMALHIACYVILYLWPA